MDLEPERLWIVTVKWRGSQKRLHLGARDTPELEQVFARAGHEIEQLGEKATNWPSFLAHSLEIFRKYGFIRVEP